MEYDKSRVYTALNADELKIGSKVCVAKNMHALKDLVLTGSFSTLTKVLSEDFQDRFEAEWTDSSGYHKGSIASHRGSFTLAYLVESSKIQTVTYRELSCWLSHGNGQCRDEDTDVVYTSYEYQFANEDVFIPLVLKVRRWGDTEWHEATKEYLEGDK